MAPRWRGVIGEELRRGRIERGLTQSGLGSPLTRGFVSAVERGLAVPSLPALAHMLARLDLSLSEFFERVEDRLVEPELTARYDSRHERGGDPQAAAPRRRRSA